MTRLGLKILAVALITIGLLVPLAMMRGLIRERAGYREEARVDIARSWTGAQTLGGPLLAIPVRLPEQGRHDDGSGPSEGRDPGYLFAVPDRLDVQASLRTELRRRGLYSLPVYHSSLVISGEFQLSWETLLPGATDGSDLDLARAFLALSLSDNRGIAGRPTLTWAGDAREISSGPVLTELGEGIHAVVGPLDPDRQTRYPFRMEVGLRGMETLRFSPIAKDTRVMIDAGWAHPSFVGGFLPVEYEIDGERFTAEWRVSGLATGWRKPWLASESAECPSLDKTFGVSLINSVDVYQQAERSVKYGNLIVLLTFTSFFLVEMVRRLMLHPMQYLLVGLALVIFFLLLLALSEHIVFWAAYLIAAVACVGLVAVYTASALGRATNTIAVTATMGALYGMLYAILKSEDNALLMGTLLLFFALAAVMLVTRRFDWYRLGREIRPTGPGDAPQGTGG